MHNPANLSRYLHDRLAALPDHHRLLIACSGGPDSTALLHAACQHVQPATVIAVHIDHRLDPESGNRADATAALAAQLNVPCRIIKATVTNAGQGLEAAAREARYACLKAEMNAGDIVLTAHHADDQAETILLRIMRASGPAALSGIRPLRPFGPGWLARPLLECTRSELQHYLEYHHLRAQLDPGNHDLQRDRNFVRHRLLPCLAERWPGYREALLTTAALAAEAGQAQQTLASSDLAGCADGAAIVVAQLLQLDDARQRALLRYWCATRQAPPPPARRLAVLLEQLTAPPDRHPEIRWSGWILRRMRGRLYLLPATEALQ